MWCFCRYGEETLDVAAWASVAVPLAWLMDDSQPITLRAAGPDGQQHAWSQSLFRPRGAWGGRQAGLT